MRKILLAATAAIIAIGFTAAPARAETNMPVGEFKTIVAIENVCGKSAQPICTKAVAELVAKVEKNATTNGLVDGVAAITELVALNRRLGENPGLFDSGSAGAG